MYDDGTHGDASAETAYSPARFPREPQPPARCSAGTSQPPTRLPIPAAGRSWCRSSATTAVRNTRARSSPIPRLPARCRSFSRSSSNPSAADNWSDRTGSRASVYYLGRFYDNVFVYCRGGYTTHGNKFKFNSGYDFNFAEDQDPVKTINLNQQGWDDTYARPEVAFDTYERQPAFRRASSFPFACSETAPITW